jgi:hypothetical protein
MVNAGQCWSNLINVLGLPYLGAAAFSHRCRRQLYTTNIYKRTGYDMIQNTASAGQFEAVVKLVEAGASWRLAKGQRDMAGSGFYVPEILSAQKPRLKVRRSGSLS